MDDIVAIIIVLAALWIHFMPTVEAYRTDHPQRRAIAMLNIIGGWTVIGWIGAMVWAHTARDQRPNPHLP